MDSMEVWSVGGYLFGSNVDAEIARKEEKKIEYLEERLDHQNKQSVLNVYNKMIEEKIFKTPVGWEFLRKLQQELKAAEIEQVKDIPLYTVFEHSNEPAIPRQRIKGAKPKQDKRIAGFRIAVIISVIMTILVIAMFQITLSSPQPNVLNYERALVDKYAAWEEELSQREQTVREKEIEYQIEEN